MSTPTPWAADWEQYYQEAESIAGNQFSFLIDLIGKERFCSFDLKNTLDFACGHGRMAEQFARFANKITCCDIQPSSVEFCRNRFVNGRPNCTFDFVCNTMTGIPLPDGIFTFVYSWDAMVHLDYANLELYFREFKRLLCPGGKAVIHHSNYKYLVPEANTIWNDNPHCRASVSAQGVDDLVRRLEMEIISQHPMIWAHDQDLDCVTIFKKPSE